MYSFSLAEDSCRMMAAERLAYQTDRITVRVHSGGPEVTENVIGDWLRMSRSNHIQEVFYYPEWIRASLRAFFPNSQTRVFSAWSDGQLQTVLPLVKDRTYLAGLPARRLRFPSTAHSVRAGLIVQGTADPGGTMQALWESIKKNREWDLIDLGFVLEGNHLDLFAKCAEADGFKVTRRRLLQSLHEPVSVIEAKNPAAPLSRKFRATLRRCRRQLESLGAISFRHYEYANSDVLQRFYDLEASGWKGKQGTAIDRSPETRQFYDDVAQAAADRGILSLDFLELDGKPIAGHFAFGFRGRYLLAKAGYDERFHRYSPGQLLVQELLNKAQAFGIKEIDFVGPAAWSESRWASQRRTHLGIRIFQKSLYGNLLHGMTVSAPSLAKSLLGRKHDNTNLPLLAMPRGHEEEAG